MTTSILGDAFAHHIWANERILDACASLTPEQLREPMPGTYGPIIATLNHIVEADNYYLSILRPGRVPRMQEGVELSLDELRAANTTQGAEYEPLLAGQLDPDADTVARGDGGSFHATLGIRLAQIVHHGTDHRSQVCTALTSLGIEPPEIDLWAYGEFAGRTRDEVGQSSV